MAVPFKIYIKRKKDLFVVSKYSQPSKKENCTAEIHPKVVGFTSEGGAGES